MDNFAYFAKQGEFWERVEGNWYCRVTCTLLRGDLGCGDLHLFCQARRVLGESGGGIGIAGEPAHCNVSVFFS